MDAPAPSKLPRIRKPNFTASEENILRQEVEKNIDVLTQKFTSSTTNKQKKVVWTGIAQKISALGVSSRTSDEVRDKWRNIIAKAKGAYTTQKAEMMRTGGGPAPQPPSADMQQVISLYQDTASFTGIDGGLETEIFYDAEPEPEPVDPVMPMVCPLSPAIMIRPRGKTPVKPNESTETLTQVTKSQSKTNRKRTSVEDVYSLQVEVLQGQKEEQQLRKEKLKLQIQLLKQMCAKSGQRSSVNGLSGSQEIALIDVLDL